jgi:Na+/proline symporter
MHVQMRRLAPNAHTFGEVIKARWGTSVHLMVVLFIIFQNITVGALLLWGGGLSFAASTGEDSGIC